MKVREHEPLAPRTTLGVGGAARFFAEARDEAQVREALAWARDRGIDVVILGGGSNALVADAGLDALVLRPAIRGVRDLGAGVVEAAAGEPWDAFVEAMVAKGYAGLECLSGIPGDVGATPIQNVGAYGQDVSETIEVVTAIDRATCEIVKIDAQTCAFAYRDSAFKRAWMNRFVITRVTFALRDGGAPRVRYAELERALARTATAQGSLRLDDVRREVLRLRRSKSMVLDATDENGKSAGSFFTNPILDGPALASALARIDAAGVLATGEQVPRFAAENSAGTKLAAGWLIERAGFTKGFGEGRVGLSTKHALAVVNRGGATAADVVAFARRVQQGVRDRFGVTLRPEPVFLGFDRASIGDLLGD